MKRYAVKMLTEGKRKFYYILDNETQDRRKPFSEHRKANGLCNMLLYGIPQSEGDRAGESE